MAFQNNGSVVPKERKNGAKHVSLAICVVAAILTLIFCFTSRTVIEYYPDTTRQNTTDICYIKREKLAFPDLFAVALGLNSIVLGTLVDRLALVAEERHHLAERYDGSRVKMIKACFSGIFWGPVICLISLATVILVLIILLTNQPWFELRYLVIFLNGISVGPLIIRLLNLNTQSEVQISMITEEKGINVGNSFAWYYYYNQLRSTLQKFHEAVRSEPNKMELSLDKLLLLMPLNCDMNDTDNLIALDEKMEKVNNDFVQKAHQFSVYRCAIDDHEYRYFAIHWIKDPMLALRQMRESSLVNSVTLETYKDDVKLLYRTLSQILKNPPTSDYDSTRRGLLVPITVKNGDEESLRNGGLVRCIMNTVEPLYVFKQIGGSLVQQWKRRWKGFGKCTHKDQPGNITLRPDARNKESDENNVQIEKKKEYKEIQGSCVDSDDTFREKDV